MASKAFPPAKVTDFYILVTKLFNFGVDNQITTVINLISKTTNV